MTPTSIDTSDGSGPCAAGTMGRGHPADAGGGEPPALLTLVAHELRDPLGLLGGYLSMLEEGDLTDEQRTGAVKAMRAKVLEMAHLVEVLLTTSRLDAGGLAPRITSFEVRGAVEEAMEVVDPRAMLAQASIEATWPMEPVTARADRGHVVRILVNLLSNALSYSRRPPRINIDVQPGDPVRVAVRDRGPGIPARQRERVFERFTRLEGKAAARTPGFGLGLPLSRELAEASGGTLELEMSAPRRGSLFVLRLPAAEAIADGE